MPQPPALLQLANAQRRAQDQLARAMSLSLLASYRQMITAPPTRTAGERWIAAMIPLVLAFRARSSGLAAVFYERAHTIALPGVALDFETPPDDDEVPEEAIATSLAVTGLVGVTQRLEAGESLAYALEHAAIAADGAAVRHVLEGGRSYTRNAAAADRLAVGYYRQTKGDPCSFCAVLASRGAVYKADSFADSDPQFRDDPDMPSTEKVHDNCHCTLQPIWRRTSDDPLDDAADLNRSFRALWDTATQGYSGRAALNAFRRAYEASLRAQE